MSAPCLTPRRVETCPGYGQPVLPGQPTASDGGHHDRCVECLCATGDQACTYEHGTRRA